MKKKRVIILGGNGFVSSRVLDFLKKKKILIKNYSRKNLDLSKKITSNKLKKIIKKNDYVFFAAAKAPVKNMEMLIYNLKILKIISNGIEYKKIKKFIYLSSDAVYTDTKKKIDEFSATEPKSLHGIMHLLREDYFKNCYKDKVCIVRPTLIYGPDDPHSGYGPNKFIRDIKNKKKINIFGKGEELRDHIFIDDVAKLITKFILNNFFGIINLATGRVTSFQKIAYIVKKIGNSKIPFKYLKRTGPMPHLGYRSFDIKKLKKITNNYKMVSLNQGIEKNFKYY